MDTCPPKHHKVPDKRDNTLCCSLLSSWSFLSEWGGRFFCELHRVEESGLWLVSALSFPRTLRAHRERLGREGGPIWPIRRESDRRPQGVMTMASRLSRNGKRRSEISRSSDSEPPGKTPDETRKGRAGQATFCARHARLDSPSRDIFGLPCQEKPGTHGRTSLPIAARIEQGLQNVKGNISLNPYFIKRYIHIVCNYTRVNQLIA